MATPTTAERRLLAFGLKKASAWRTAVALGTGAESRVKAISGFAHGRDYSPGHYANQPFTAVGTLTDVKPVDAGFSGDMLYDPGSLGIAIAELFGTAGTPSVTDTTAQTHIFQWADLGTGFCTLAAEYPALIYEIPSWKPTDLSFKVGGGRIEFDIKGRGNTLTDSSAVNGATQMDALTFTGQDAPVLFNHASIKMNLQSGAAVSGTTALVDSGFSVDYKRNYDSIHVAGYDNLIEPCESGFPEIKLKLEFPRFAADNQALQASLIAGTVQKAEITFTSPLLCGSATVHYAMTLTFPGLRIVSQTADWAEIVKNGVELVAEQAATNPTGMSYLRPYVTIVNKFASNYLA